MEMIIPWAIFAVVAAAGAGSCLSGAEASPVTPTPEVRTGSKDAPRSDCKSWELRGLRSRVGVCRKLVLPRVFT